MAKTCRLYYLQYSGQRKTAQAKTTVANHLQQPLINARFLSLVSLLEPACLSDKMDKIRKTDSGHNSDQPMRRSPFMVWVKSVVFKPVIQIL
jgi:hypothetical protein